jgi:hypothetical protein
VINFPFIIAASVTFAVSRGSRLPPWRPRAHSWRILKQPPRSRLDGLPRRELIMSSQLIIAELISGRENKDGWKRGILSEFLSPLRPSLSIYPRPLAVLQYTFSYSSSPFIAFLALRMRITSSSNGRDYVNPTARIISQLESKEGYSTWNPMCRCENLREILI